MPSDIERDIERVRAELMGLDYETIVRETAQGTTVIFDYAIEVGSHAGEKVRVGISFQEPGYPQFPPHWVHVSPPIDDQQGGSRRYTDEQGNEWLAMSRPPGELWDQLPTKHMRPYIEEHLRRIWKNV